MSKKIIFSILFVVAVLVVFGVWLGLWIFKAIDQSPSPNPAGESPYTAVYMTTGDIYLEDLASFRSRI